VERKVARQKRVEEKRSLKEQLVKLGLCLVEIPGPSDILLTYADVC
jgi:hypothetical protein